MNHVIEVPCTKNKLQLYANDVNVLGDPEVTVNIYCKSRNLPNTKTPNFSTDLR